MVESSTGAPAPATSDPRLAKMGPLNPDYGKGCYRRLIHLDARRDGVLEAALEDDAHAFAVSLRHDGRVVLDLQARAERFPLTTCPGAVEPLRALRGALLGATPAELNAHTDPSANCTHLHDLALLAIGHALRAEREWRYTITIPDAIKGRTRPVLRCNGRELLAWEVYNGVIEADAPYAGQTLLGGFTRWARAALEPDALAHSLMLQRGFYVSMSRLFDMDKASYRSAAEHPMPAGVCYSYSPERVAQAFDLPGNRRDFTDCEEQLLSWT